MIYLLLFFLMKALRADGFGVPINVWELLNLLVLIVGILHYQPIRSRKLHYTPLTQPRSFFWFFAFVGLFILSVWRSNDFVSSTIGIVKDTLTLVLLVLFVYLYQQYRFLRQRSFSQPLLLTLVHAMGIFCVMNILAVIVNPVYGQEGATTLSLVGIHTKKVLFSMYPEVHHNYVGMIGGFLFVMSWERSLFGPGAFNKIVRWVYIASGLMVVLVSDSRSNLAAALVSVIIVTMLRNAKSLPLVKYSVLLVPFSSILFLLSLQFMATFSTVQNLSRDSRDLATGNSRKFIYDAAYRELGDFKPVHLIGYGEYGPYGARITRYYMSYFHIDDKETELNASVAHNTALQAIFDTGYLGLLAFSMLMYFAMHYCVKLYQAGYPEYLGLLSYFIFNIIAGFTTSRFGNYHEVANQLFIVFCFLIFSTYQYDLFKKKEKAPPVRPPRRVLEPEVIANQMTSL